MSIFSILVDQVVAGNIKSHQLISSVKQGDLYEANGKAARFRKIRSGAFDVELFEGDLDKPVKTYKAASPVEAKLTLLDWLASDEHEAVEPEPAAAKTATKRR